MVSFSFECYQCPECGSTKIKCNPKEDKRKSKTIKDLFKKLLVREYICTCSKCGEKWICFKGIGVLN